MKSLARNVMLPLLAVAATAIPPDPARACSERRPAAEPASAARAVAALDAAPEFCLRRPTLRAF